MLSTFRDNPLSLDPIHCSISYFMLGLTRELSLSCIYNTENWKKCLLKDGYQRRKHDFKKSDRSSTTNTLDLSGKSSTMDQTRRLAAIMFTDIQGYTAMMQRDEKKVIELRERHRDIFDSKTEKYKGEILQYYGDGTLSIFSSAIDAVECGTEMQLAFLEEPKIPVRIGIHTGDIVYSKEEIIGDGVNVASRIESLAIPGSVFISDKVYDEIKNQSSIQTRPLKTFELKKIKERRQTHCSLCNFQ